jgi:8-oxo-dGTP pyrophosphatase MutT (NUDIX family)
MVLLYEVVSSTARLMTKVGTGIVILDPTRSTVLLLRYVKSGEWGRPGGAVEAGETALNGAVREVAEETGLDLTQLVESIHLVEWAEGASLTPPVPWVAAGFAVVLPEGWPMDGVAIRESHVHDGLIWESVEAILRNGGRTTSGEAVNAFTLSTLRKFVAAVELPQ